MKFTFNNLGPVSDGELELGGLTVLCGDNNSGKTYVAYTIYGYCTLSHDYAPHLNRKSNDDHSLLNDEFLHKLFTTGENSVPIESETLVRMGMKYLEKINKQVNYELHTVFASHPQTFTRDSVAVITSEDEIKKWVKFRLGKLSGYRPMRDLELKLEGNQLFFTIKSEKRMELYSNQFATAKYFLLKNLESFLFKPPLSKPFILTSERLGISLFYKDLDASRNALAEALQKLDKKDRRQENVRIHVESRSRYAKPISDEIHFARDLSEVAKKKTLSQKTGLAKLYGEVVKMMKANYKADETHVRLVSTLRGKNHFDMPLHMASASSREMAHLYFYLKHEADESDLLILDEPESHLSTKNQRLLARLLCSCVKSGLGVLLTTHSDILIKEINNMIILDNIRNKNDEFRKKCADYKELEGLGYDQVKAYICESKRIKPMVVDRDGINIDYFNHEPVRQAHDRDNLSYLARLQPAAV